VTFQILMAVNIRIVVKIKVHHITDHEGPEGE
jgi:hypothetical protein